MASVAAELAFTARGRGCWSRRVNRGRAVAAAEIVADHHGAPGHLPESGRGAVLPAAAALVLFGTLGGLGSALLAACLRPNQGVVCFARSRA